MKSKFILLVEDKELERRNIERDFLGTLEHHRLGCFEVKIKSTGSKKKAYKLYKENFFDLIILDLRLEKGGNGLDLLRKIRENDKTTPILILSGQAEDKDMQEIGKHPNNYFFGKAFTDIGGGNPRLEQCKKCLAEGEENFEKNHRDFYLPAVLLDFLFESDLYEPVFSIETKKNILQYYRDPEKGFKGKGIVSLFGEIGDYVLKKISDIRSEMLPESGQVDFKEIMGRLRGVYSLENMEQFLNMEPNYREHFVHQFQNFLLGCILYKKFKSKINPYIKTVFSRHSAVKEENLQGLFETSWYLTAFFHDYGYPIQYYDKVLSHYFKENFRYRFSPASMDTESLILHEGLGDYFDSIANDFWGDETRKEEFKMLLVHQFKMKNHAVHSSIALRKLIRYHESEEAFSKLFSPVFSAIAMHDWGLWSKSQKVEDFLKENEKKLKIKTEFRYKLDFFAGLDKNPLLHILVLVDTMQCWGRSIGFRNFYTTNRLELTDLRDEREFVKIKKLNEKHEVVEKEEEVDFLAFELNVREGLKSKTSKKIFCEYCRTFKTLSVILGYEGLPVKIILNQGPFADNTVKFRLGIGEVIDCKDTNGCPRKT